MEVCLICGEEYDPALNPDHEEECQERLAESANIEVKSDPKLTSMLEGLLNGKR